MILIFLLPSLLVNHLVTAQGGCKTIRAVMDCTNLGLTNIPDFSSTGSLVREINLQNNRLTTIPAHAFRGTRATTINLEGNQIKTIADGGFDAVYNTLKVLNLRNNNLTGIPREIGNLNNITTLNIKDTDITGPELDRDPSDSALKKIGNSLTEFHFGGRNFYLWPNKALTHFPKLKILNYEGGHLAFIPYNGFHGFEQTLKKLYISKTEMRQMPIGLSTLTHLEELHYDDNTLGDDNSILAQAFATTTHQTSPLKVLSLQNDGLTRFPSVLRNLVNLEELRMDRNRLWYVADDAVELLKQAKLTKMGLSGCHLDRIPQALLKLGGLQQLDVSANNIQSIERYDMSSHANITVLNVSGNPLAYISSEALKNLPSLETLDFSKSAMTQIPEAIKNTHSLTKLDLTGDLIECTCDLTWVSSSLKTRINFVGTCETIEKPIDSYLDDRVPNCPSRRK